MALADHSLPFPSLASGNLGHSHGCKDDDEHGHGHSHRRASHSLNFGPSSLQPFLDKSVLSVFSRNLKQLWADVDSQWLIIFIFLKLAYLTIALFLGIFTFNPLLVMNALHISMDCIALVVSLFSIVLASKKPSSTFTYGFERIEVINAFSMACFLMFMGFFQIMEALHHAFSSVEIESGESKNGIFALAIGILGFVLDLFGLLMLRKYSNLNHARKFRGKYNGARMVNMHGLFLHTLCDSFSQAVVVFIAWLDRFQVTSIEILITWIIGFAMVYTAYPLLVLTGSILLQSSPRELKPILEKHLREISTFDGVLECRTAHWWSQSPGSVIGTLNVRVRTDANEQEILTFIHQLLHEYVSDLTIQIEKDAPIDWMTHHTN